MGQSYIRHYGMGMFMTCEIVTCESLQPAHRHPYMQKYFSIWRLEKNSHLNLCCNSRDYIFEVVNKIRSGFGRKLFFFFFKYPSEASGAAALESNCRWQRHIYTLKLCYEIQVCCKNTPSTETVTKLSVFLSLDITFLGR